MKRILIICSGVFIINACTTSKRNQEVTEIAKWQFDKKAAVSVTYDDGSVNQFRKAIPIMNSLNIPGTFFINTGQIAGSEFHGKFIGRPVKTIIEETRETGTNSSNFYERASAARYLGYKGTNELFTRAGSEYDGGNQEEAYKIIDQLYKKVRSGELKAESPGSEKHSGAEAINWDDIRSFAGQGHEFASHMVTHPYMAALDEANMMYELEKSREEIFKKLGPKYTFSAECPYGTENERVMEYAHKVYPALRNRMPESFLEEMNRSSRGDPGSSDREYVQWQRGATTKTPFPMMRSWIDTISAHDNIWLVLVIHGVDSVGWEALPSGMLEEYFRYIRSKDNDIWIATFADVARYMRERMNSSVQTRVKRSKITIDLSHSLDTTLYNLPLTLKSYVPSKWELVSVKQNGQSRDLPPLRDNRGSFVLYQAYPNSGTIEISGH
jgi:peptidoglycan/xylan/chitin deacetylase (PgdA/CDA1 family)